MGIKNSKQSVNISTVPKKDTKKSEVTEKGDTSKASDENLKGETINEVSSPNIKADDNLEPTKDAESNGLDGNGQVVPVLKVEDVEVNGEEEEGDKEVPKPTMSKIASMKRDLSFGRLQKMFSREPKSESQQDSSVNAAELEPSPAPEVSATDEKLIKAEEAMGEEVTSEEVKSEEAKGDEEAKGEDIESRVTGLKKSLMKMFARESESEGATETLAATATEKEGDEEKIEGKEATPAKMTSLKKRLSFKAMRSKFSKEKKEAGSVEDNNEEEKEMEGKENAKTESNEKEDDEEESEEKEESTVKTSSLKKRLSFKVMRSKFSKEKKGADAGEDNTEEKKESEEKDIEKKENKETEDEMEEDEINKEAEAPSLVKDNCFKAMKSKFSKEKKEADACEENNDLEKENARTEDVEKEEVDDDETEQKVEEPSLVKDNCFKAMKSKFSKEKKEVSASEENVEKKEGDVREEVAADETKQEVETPAHADAKVVNEEEGEAESGEGPTSSTVAATVLPEELTQSYADAVKQPEIVAEVLVGSEGGLPELESSNESKMM